MFATSYAQNTADVGEPYQDESTMTAVVLKDDPVSGKLLMVRFSMNLLYMHILWQLLVFTSIVLTNLVALFRPLYDL